MLSKELTTEIITALQSDEALPFSPLLLLSLCLQDDQRDVLLDHIMRFHSASFSVADKWLFDSQDTLYVDAIADEVDEAVTQQASFIQQRYSQTIDKEDGYEHYFFTCIRFTTKDGNPLAAPAPELLDLANQFCELASRHIASVDIGEPLNETMTELLTTLKAEFDKWPNHNVDFAAYRIDGNDDEARQLTGICQGQQKIINVVGSDPNGSMLYDNTSGDLVDFTGEVESGSQIAVITQQQYKLWEKALPSKISEAATDVDNPQAIGFQMIPALLAERTFTTEKKAELNPLDVKKTATFLYSQLAKHKAYAPRFFGHTACFPKAIARLRAQNSHDLVDYIFYLMLERNAIANKNSAIATALDATIEFGKKLMTGTDYLKQLEARGGATDTPLQTAERSILVNLLAKSYAVENSWDYWIEQALMDFPPNNGSIAQATTLNFIIDKIWYAETFDSLQVINPIILALQEKEWPDDFKCYLGKLADLMETNLNLNPNTAI